MNFHACTSAQRHTHNNRLLRLCRTCTELQPPGMSKQDRQVLSTDGRTLHCMDYFGLILFMTTTQLHVLFFLKHLISVLFNYI